MRHYDARSRPRIQGATAYRIGKARHRRPRWRAFTRENNRVRRGSGIVPRAGAKAFGTVQWSVPSSEPLHKHGDDPALAPGRAAMPHRPLRSHHGLGHLVRQRHHAHKHDSHENLHRNVPGAGAPPHKHEPHRPQHHEEENDPEGLVVPLLLVAGRHDVVGSIARATLTTMGPVAVAVAVLVLEDAHSSSSQNCSLSFDLRF